MTRSHEAIVVGAGPAGLAASRELARAGVDHRVLERGDLYVVGHNYDIRGALFNIAHDAPRAARMITRSLRT